MDTPIQLPDVLQVETLKIIEIFGYLFFHKLHQQMPLVYTSTIFDVGTPM